MLFELLTVLCYIHETSEYSHLNIIVNVSITFTRSANTEWSCRRRDYFSLLLEGHSIASFEV